MNPTQTSPKRSLQTSRFCPTPMDRFGTGKTGPAGSGGGGSCDVQDVWAEGNVRNLGSNISTTHDRFQVLSRGADQWSDERGALLISDRMKEALAAAVVLLNHIIFIFVSNPHTNNHQSLQHHRHQPVLTFPVLKRCRFFCSDASAAAGSPGCGRVSNRLK